MRTDLVIVDGLNDFCASGDESWNKEKKRGSLFVADADMEGQLVGEMIGQLGSKIDNIYKFCDEHHKNDIAHPGFWKKSDGTHPDPFTGPVTAQQIQNGELVPVRDELLLQVIEYVIKLELRGRNPLIIWPEHCLFKSWGSNVYFPIANALDYWCEKTGRWVEYIDKGRYPLSEHYGGFEADVPVEDHPETKFNLGIRDKLKEADRILWAGWAGSHCLKWTVTDCINSCPELAEKSVLFEDASAPVVSPDSDQTRLFSEWRDDFLHKMSEMKVTITTTGEVR